MPVWKPPHISKVYEALSAIADKRIQLVSENTAHVTSTSRGKFYTVTYEPTTSSIMSNDNTAFYTKSISYPMIALLMLKEVIDYNPTLLSPLQNIPWKDLNQQHDNNYDQSISYYFTHLFPTNLDSKLFKTEVSSIYQQVFALQLNFLGTLRKPSSTY